MHKLRNIKIENFKSIKHLELILDDYTPIVGYNNAGKSNILEAIEWFLKPYKTTESDFNDERGGNPLVVEGVIEGISNKVLENLAEEHAKRIEPYLIDEKLTIRRELDNPSTATKATPLLLDPETGDFGKSPTGFSNSIKALFPEPIFIRAMEDANEDIGKSKSTSTIVKLLKEITEPIIKEHTDKLDKLLGEVGNMFSADGESRVKGLTDIDSEIQKSISFFFPGVEALINIEPPTSEDLFMSGGIKIREEGGEILRDFETLGHGAQRSVQMALIKYLSEKKGTDPNSVERKIIIIEEPELYLHPQSIRFLSSALKKLSGTDFQVIFATHSPIMISKYDVGNTSIIKKSKEKGTYKSNTLYEIAQEYGDKGTFDILFSIENLINILFCEKVIIVEGKTEKRLLPRLFEAHTETSAYQTEVGFIFVAGADQIGIVSEILHKSGINHSILTDLDFVFNQAVNNGFIDSNNESLKSAIKRVNELIDDLSLDISKDWKEKNKRLGEKDILKMLEDESFRENVSELHEVMLESNVWIWKDGAIEKPLGLSSKKLKHHNELLLNVGESGLEKSVADFDEISRLLEWFKE